MNEQEIYNKAMSSLPIRTTLEDIVEICGYLSTKPTGATLHEAKSVLDSRRLDGRKLSALKFWGLIAADEDKLILTPKGRELAKGESWRRSVLLGVVRNVPAYAAVIERANHRREDSLSSTDVAAHWYEHFRSDVGDTDKIINDQALCFFHVANGAELGKTVPGRLGHPTRLEFDPGNVAAFVKGGVTTAASRQTPAPIPGAPTATHDIPPDVSTSADGPVALVDRSATAGYLHHGLQVDCYRLLDRLGSGFSAEVWSAAVQRVPPGVDLHEGQKVAIKFYTTNALAIPDQVIRIEREYRIAQRMRHPHLIRIYEFLLASPRPHHNFLVMDIAPGPTLSSAIGHDKFEITDALRILAQLFSGASALHEAGALHRDIKPGNVSFARRDDGSPRCVLLDLGIVSPMFEKGVTAVSRFVGSKHWAPLEQLIGLSLDQRSDLYSVGAVAYNLLVGVEPFTASATEAAVAVEMSRNGLRIPELAGLPTEIVDMLNACLSNKQGERPRNARECLTVLKRHGIEP